MGSEYDMNVDSDTLRIIEDKLKKINNALSESTNNMLYALQAPSQGFLAGHQFEKAKKATMDCIDVTGNAVNNLNNAINYIASLRNIIEKYSMCGYGG